MSEKDSAGHIEQLLAQTRDASFETLADEVSALEQVQETLDAHLATARD